VFACATQFEGLPYSLLESMEAGAVPVITPVGAIPDVMQDHVQGLFLSSRAPPAIADALALLNADRALLQRLAAAGRQRIVSHYSIARLSAELQNLYASLI
jgi:glycosyltransferase involved in cell wall biosynthesis